MKSDSILAKFGLIPEDWEIYSLQDLSSEPISYGIVQAGPNLENGIPYIRTGDISNGVPDIESLYRTSSEIDSQYSRSRIKSNDLIIALRGNVGHVILIPPSLEDINISRGVAKIRPNELVIPTYLLWALKSSFVKRIMKIRTQGSTFREISLKVLREIPIPVPPMVEQEKIAIILRTLEELYLNTVSMIDKYHIFKNGLRHHLLTKGIGHTNFKKTKIGEIPESWDVIPIGELADYINGYAFKPSDWETSGLPIIRIQQLNDRNAEFDYYSGELDEKYLITNGDLIFSWSGTLGAHIWNRGDAYLNQHLFKVIPNSKIDKMFLYFLIQRSIPRLSTYSHGSTMKHITRKVLEHFHVAIPPLKEQKDISAILSRVESRMQLEEKMTTYLVVLKKGLMQVLLTGKVRVQV